MSMQIRCTILRAYLRLSRGFGRTCLVAECKFIWNLTMNTLHGGCLGNVSVHPREVVTMGFSCSQDHNNPCFRYLSLLAKRTHKVVYVRFRKRELT